MSNVLVDQASLQDIADAIRSKLGIQDTYKPSEMADAIESISGGGITPTGTKQINVTQNGTVTEDVTSYASAQVNVNVPQPSGTMSITENGTYDVTNYASADVSVAGSGANFASGTYTPSENQNVFTIDTGIAFTRFVMFATTNVYQAGSGVRTISAILYDSNMGYTWRIGSNAAGTAGSATVPTSGFSISGTQFVVNTDQFFLGGYTYNWVAW